MSYKLPRGLLGHDRMIVGFITTYAISAYPLIKPPSYMAIHSEMKKWPYKRHSMFYRKF
jgi:hypothetical protein